MLIIKKIDFSRKVEQKKKKILKILLFKLTINITKYTQFTGREQPFNYAHSTMSEASARKIKQLGTRII